MQTIKTFDELEQEYKHLVLSKRKNVKGRPYNKSALIISNTAYDILKCIKYNDAHNTAKIAKYLEGTSLALILYSLRNLVKDGFVSRVSHSYHHQDYEITDLGHMIMAVIQEKELLENKQCIAQSAT